MATIIVAYGCILVFLGILQRSLAPDSGYLTLVTGMVGGAVAIGCGVMAWLERGGRIWIILTVVVAGLILLAQTVGSWGGPAEQRNTAEALVHSLMLGLTAAMLKYTVHGERPPGFFTPGGLKHDPKPNR